jgi:hypothetical protein
MVKCATCKRELTAVVREPLERQAGQTHLTGASRWAHHHILQRPRLNFSAGAQRAAGPRLASGEEWKLTVTLTPDGPGVGKSNPSAQSLPGEPNPFALYVTPMSWAVLVLLRSGIAAFSARLRSHRPLNL